MENAFYLTLGQAAKETGVSKATIFKAIKSGKLSYVGKTQAGYKIDPAELFRVFQKKKEGVTENGKSEQSATPENDLENAFLRRENELLRQQLEREREQADHWRRQATALLTQQPGPEPAAAPDQAQPDKGRLWQKLFGRNPPKS